MKNKKSIIVRVLHFFYAMLSVVILQSCGNGIPIIDGETPFVVGTIKKYSNTHSMYISDNQNSGQFVNPMQGYPTIILPSRMYNVGDTIKSVFCNLK